VVVAAASPEPGLPEGQTGYWEDLGVYVRGVVVSDQMHVETLRCLDVDQSKFRPETHPSSVVRSAGESQMHASVFLMPANLRGLARLGIFR
jgi:hypothetical protein